MFWLCIIVLLSWIVWLHLPLLPTVSTSYCHSLQLPICLCSYCIIVLLCIIELYWIVLLHCIVYLHIPLSLQWVPVYISSPHPHVCLCLYFSCRKDDLFEYWHGVLLPAPLCIIIRILPLTLTFILGNLFASTIAEGSRPCPHPYKYLLSWGMFGVCLLLLIDCMMIVMSPLLLCPLFLFPVSKLFSRLVL